MATGRLVFDQFNLVVSDMAATVAFYRLLGLEIPDTLAEWQDHHRTAILCKGVDLDFDSVEFARKWNGGWPGGSGGHTGVLGFRLGSREEVDAAYTIMTGAGYNGQCHRDRERDLCLRMTAGGP